LKDEEDVDESLAKVKNGTSKVKKEAKKETAQVKKKKKNEVEEDASSGDNESTQVNGEKNGKQVTAVKFDKEEFKYTTEKKDWNFKIVSWNINGIRAWIEVFFNSLFLRS
jgi:uncharacterized protein YkuJ